MDRRTFLRGSSVTAASSMMVDLERVARSFDPAPQLPAPIANPMAFDWVAGGGLRLSFEFLDQRLRSQSILPGDIPKLSGMPLPTQNSGLETALHCTGENADDHHGLKLTGG